MRKTILTLTIAGTLALGATAYSGNVTPRETTAATDTGTPAPSATTSSAPAAPAPAAPATPSTTTSQEQALKKAQSYLSFMAFSKAGLIKQLLSTTEGFTTADATWAVTQLQVDWQEQAVKKAQSYLLTQAFSRASLIRQLAFEGFTQAEATYAAGRVGL